MNPGYRLAPAFHNQDIKITKDRAKKKKIRLLARRLITGNRVYHKEKEALRIPLSCDPFWDELKRASRYLGKFKKKYNIELLPAEEKGGGEGGEARGIEEDDEEGEEEFDFGINTPNIDDYCENAIELFDPDEFEFNFDLSLC